ncbi:hypothetical protein SORBI_3002G120601, partial [Sorghum bicolor]
MNHYHFDVVCLQETIKRDFSYHILKDLVNGQEFSWIWTEAEGHSGGILTGVKNGDIEVINHDRGSFFASIRAKNRKDGLVWEVINVYGPVQHERKQNFLEELTNKIHNTQCSFILGGDFNLIRFASEKSTQNADQGRMDMFNNFISDTGIREMLRKGGKFTWTNKQEQPIMSTLDRVFIRYDWEFAYPWATCEVLTRIGSDHNPLLVTTEDTRVNHPYIFRFEMAWFTDAEFQEKLVNRWPNRESEDIQDYWKRVKKHIRTFCKGWGNNVRGQLRKDKRALMEEIKLFETRAEDEFLNATQWSELYAKEQALEQIYAFEEIQWQKRGGEKWILQGDANTGFFHNKANERKKKCTIFSLEDDDRIISGDRALREHIEEYYKKLFGSEEDRGVSIEDDFWSSQEVLSEEEANELIKPFSVSEIEAALKDMDSNSAPGPDGLPAGFYKKMWPHIGETVVEMFNKLHFEELNMSRMNYDMITLIPKLKEANNIKQNRPICLLNADYKWFTKVLTMRLAKVANKIISPSQTAFIPGRFILEGIVMLHE